MSSFAESGRQNDSTGFHMWEVKGELAEGSGDQGKRGLKPPSPNTSRRCYPSSW
jgi:hypothetical protein